MADSQRIAFYKTLLLGDFLGGIETLEVVGDDPSFGSPLYNNVQTPAERGGISRYEAEIGCILMRNIGESDDAFMRRRLTFLINVRRVRGYWPSTDRMTYGPLAILDTNQPATPGTPVGGVYQTTLPSTAGSAVPITVSATISSVADGTRFFITDGVGHEIFEAAASGFLAQITAKTLKRSYVTNAIVFSPTWYLETAYMQSGVRISGLGEEGSRRVAKDIRIKFVTVDDPYWGA